MQKIDIHLPKSYSDCSLQQLRMIARAFVEQSEHSSSLVPFDFFAVKAKLFLSLSGIRCVDVAINDNDEREYICLRSDNKTTFRLQSWQIASWLNESKDGEGKKVAGALDWLDVGVGDGLIKFPFPTYRHLLWTFQGPNLYLDGFTWQQYRFAQDFLQAYTLTNNNYLRFRTRNNKAWRKQALQAFNAAKDLRCKFLANLFDGKESYIDANTGKSAYGYHFNPKQFSRNASHFRKFTDTDWQLVLLWWQSQMSYLQRTYPKVFRHKSTGSEPRGFDPMKFYTRTTATMEKYLGITAADVDREPYTTVLQQMEDIVRSNEEIEKINKKSKK